MTQARHIDVVKAIAERNVTKPNKGIKTREDRQKWWSGMMDTAEKDSDKLKASELLGRSNADFTDTMQHTGKGGGPVKIQSMDSVGLKNAIRKRS